MIREFILFVDNVIASVILELSLPTPLFLRYCSESIVLVEGAFC